MSDNGNLHLIFKAELIDKKVVITNNTTHIPTLDYISAELNFSIIELRAMNKVKEEMAKQNLIKVALPDILTRLRGRK